VALVVGLEINGWGYIAAFFFAGTAEGFKMTRRICSGGSQIDGSGRAGVFFSTGGDGRSGHAAAWRRFTGILAGGVTG